MNNPLWYPSGDYLKPVLGDGIEVDAIKLNGTVYTGLTWYPEVNTHADLPAAADHSGEIYIVRTATGLYFVSRKKAGMWRSDGADWYYFGKSPIWVRGNMVGTVNGVNDTYTFPNGDTPIINAEWIYLQGQFLYPTVGYNITGGTVTMQPGYIPKTGNVLYTVYQKA